MDPDVRAYLDGAKRCECEHESHVGDSTSTAHRYGGAVATKVITTMYGEFWVCDDCVVLH